MPVAGVGVAGTCTGAGAGAIPSTSARGGAGDVDASAVPAARPDANPADGPAAAGTGVGGFAAAAERTMEVMRADWQMLWACTTGW